MLNWLAGLFANPAMLWWIPAAAAPILIHLWNRRKYREVSWAAMEYLLAAIVKSSRRMRIEQLLLLLVRTALILFVVLALAEPFLSAIAAPFVPGERTHRVIVIDGSYSMQYQPADKSVFSVAKERAIQIVENAEEGDGFSLILMGESPRVIVGTAAYDKGDFIDEIESLKLPHGGADLSAALQSAQDVIQQVADDQDELRRHSVYVISDLGLNTWSEERRGARAANFAEWLRERNANNVVEVMPLGKPGADNAAITDLSVRGSFATVAQPVTFMAKVRNFSSQPRLHQLAELWIDGRRVDQQFVDILPGEETPPIIFAYRFQSPGDHALEVRLGGDSLDIDNRRYLALPVKEHLEALLVSGKRGSTLPLEAALDGGDFGRGLRGIIRPQVVSESALLELDLARYDCIFLCNVGQFTASEAQVLDAYVRQGGGLVTILGDQVMADRYNRELAGGREEGARVLPAQIGDAVYDGTFHTFDPMGFRHPMLSLWKGNLKSGFQTVPILKYYQLRLPEKTAANVVLGVGAGDPLIVEESISRGRSILVATDVATTSVVDAESRRPWSLIASWLNSQPFLESLWKGAIGGKIDERNVAVGDAFGALYEAVGDGRIFVETPQGPVEKIPPASQADAGRWSFTETDLSGIYKVRAGSEQAEPQLFAVNLKTQESDLEKLHPEDLPEGFRVSGEFQDIESLQPVESPSRELAMHSFLLYIVLTLLFVEVFLAWWIGNRST